MSAAAARVENLPDSDPHSRGSGQQPAVRGTVLLVDDEEALVRGLARALRAQGYAVTPATSGEQALEHISSERFDVIVSDVTMPGLDGLQLLRRVRDIDMTVPVVFMTGHPSVDTAMQAMEFGAFRYLTKPLDPPVFMATMDKAISFHRLARVKARAADLLGTVAAPADRAALEAAFERALESLWMAYQPIVHYRDRSVYGHEALLRSREPTFPHPGAVLDAAERLGMLDVLGRTVRERAAGPIARDPDAGLLFVNLHVNDLLDPTLSSPESDLSKIAHRVVLEITERAALQQTGDVRNRIAALREMGFRIAVDDLGAGYAGLTSFALLEPDVVKLDMSLVRGIDSNRTKQKVVRSMTTLSHDMGMLVVGEGVETPGERDALVELGCDLLQGYLFARPSPPFPQIAW